MLSMLLTHISQILPQILEITGTYQQGFAYLGAGIATLSGIGVGIGQGIAAGKGAEAVGRQPEATGKITVTMIIGQAVAETSALYGLIIAFVLSSK